MATLVQFEENDDIIFNLDRVKYISFREETGYYGLKKEPRTTTTVLFISMMRNLNTIHFPSHSKKLRKKLCRKLSMTFVG